MFKKATKLLSTMVIVAGTVVGNFSPTLALAEEAVKAGDTEGMTNTVKVKDDSLADCKRIYYKSEISGNLSLDRRSRSAERLSDKALWK